MFEFLCAFIISISFSNCVCACAHLCEYRLFDVQLVAEAPVVVVVVVVVLVFIEADLPSIMMMTFVKAYSGSDEDLNAVGSGGY